MTRPTTSLRKRLNTGHTRRGNSRFTFERNSMNAVAQLFAERRALPNEENLKPLAKKTLHYLRTRGALTPLVFWSTYDSMALAQQIHELRKAGFKVKTTMKTDEEQKRYPSYTLGV